MADFDPKICQAYRRQSGFGYSPFVQIRGKVVEKSRAVRSAVRLFSTTFSSRGKGGRKKPSRHIGGSAFFDHLFAHIQEKFRLQWMNLAKPTFALGLSGPAGIPRVPDPLGQDLKGSGKRKTHLKWHCPLTRKWQISTRKSARHTVGSLPSACTDS